MKARTCPHSQYYYKVAWWKSQMPNLSLPQVTHISYMVVAIEDTLHVVIQYGPTEILYLRYAIFDLDFIAPFV